MKRITIGTYVRLPVDGTIGQVVGIINNRLDWFKVKVKPLMDSHFYTKGALEACRPEDLTRI